MIDLKTAAKVFIIIGLVCSILAACVLPFFSKTPKVITFYIIYGIYGIITSIGALCSLKEYSKRPIIVWGVLYLPISIFAGVFMFCIREEDLF